MQLLGKSGNAGANKSAIYKMKETWKRQNWGGGKQRAKERRGQARCKAERKVKKCGEEEK